MNKVKILEHKRYFCFLLWSVLVPCITSIRMTSAKLTPDTRRSFDSSTIDYQTCVAPRSDAQVHCDRRHIVAAQRPSKHCCLIAKKMLNTIDAARYNVCMVL